MESGDSAKSRSATVGELVDYRLTAASVSRMGRFETEILTQPQNLKALINQPWLRYVKETITGC
jgi:hypothetical protein